MGFGLGPGELVIIFAILLLLFGAKRLPEIANGMGKGIRDFKRAVSGLDEASVQTHTVQPMPEATPVVAAPADEPKRLQQS
jgi:sec-independent protein translocase protein TatA